MKSPLRTLTLHLSLAALTMASTACNPSGSKSTSAPASILTKAQIFDDVSLRGYGRVSATLWTSDHAAAPSAGTVLEITCEDEARARLTQGKYLSDLSLLPGVATTEIKIDHLPLSVREISGQGLVAALRFDHRVLIVTAPDAASFQLLLAQLPSARLASLSSSAPEVEVPMWLDRWDRFGFRFYYRSWELPAGQNRSTYDFAKEFAFAEKNDRSGVMLWANQSEVDTAEGMNNRVWWNWALEAASAHKLPVGLNIMTGGKGGGSFINRHRNETTMKMPGFSGNFHKTSDNYLGANGTISWNSQKAKDLSLAGLRAIVKDVTTRPNVTSVLEPHGELRHGPHDLFLEYGPLADSTYREYLKTKYKTVAALNTAWGATFSDWSEAVVPEVASFAGWGPDALSLSGDWRIGYETPTEDLPPVDQLNSRYHNKVISTKGTPPEWLTKDFDDSAWPVAQAPGNDGTMFIPHKPAVYRRTIDVPADWIAGKDRLWLYVWDLNFGTRDLVKVALNGKVLAEDKIAHFTPHWCAVEVTSQLKAGSNQVSLRLPKAFLGYRVYLSSSEPRQYPALGKTMNARWIDFSDWLVWSRVKTAGRGMEMIRSATPDHPITLMAPDWYADGLRQLAVKYGGNFHNTGYMGAFWADYLPSIMRSSRLPFSLEPGGPARDLPAFKKQLGLYATEGLQGIDYFIHLGSIMWPDELREHFEKNLPEIKLIGKYHAPRAEVAALYSVSSINRSGYPWVNDPNTNLGAGYWSWNVRAYLRDHYESDGLTESSFADGDAARYKVVIDTNTSIMDVSMLDEIERYVSEGGTFVTFAQTGRHSPTEPDTWPISRLTGYRVTHIDPLSDDERPLRTRGLQPAPDQPVFDARWSRPDVVANGLTLEKIASDTQDLMLWNDGSVAIGMRRIGKGAIIQIGPKFTGGKLADRIEPRSSSNRPTFDTRPAEIKSMVELFSQILDWRGVTRSKANWTPENDYALVRHYESNNGLYDVWTVWNQNAKDSIEGSIQITGATQPATALDIESGAHVTIGAEGIPVTLAPLETRVFLTPRNQISEAPARWFALQRDWWRTPAASTFPTDIKPEHRFSVDLSSEWSFRPLAADESVDPLVTTNVDDSTWQKLDLGTWGMPGQPTAKRALLRKTFTVPATWTQGAPSLWLQSWNGNTFVDQGRIWLDGKPLGTLSPKGITDLNPDGVLKPGTTHTLAVEIQGSGRLVGSTGGAWLWLWPEPAARIDLAGQWSPTQDALTYTAPVNLPGNYNAMGLRRSIDVPADYSNRTVVLRAETTGQLVGVMVNGNWVRRFHHLIGDRYDLNITPWIKFGQSNVIELMSIKGPSSGRVKSVSLDFHAITGTDQDYP
jgi:hypothetical protein